MATQISVGDRISGVFSTPRNTPFISGRNNPFTNHLFTRWWQLKYFCYSHPHLGKMNPILTNIFQMGWFINQKREVIGKWNHNRDQLTIVDIIPSKKERFGCVFCRGWLDLQTTSDLRSHDSEGGMNDYIAQMSSKRSLYVSSNSCGISGLQIKPAAQPDPA